MGYPKVLLSVLLGWVMLGEGQSGPSTSGTGTCDCESNMFSSHISDFESGLAEQASIIRRMDEILNAPSAASENRERVKLNNLDVVEITKSVLGNGTCLHEYALSLPDIIRQGGWITIQHRYDGSVNFKRTWREYKNGFGDPRGEFWLGLEKVHKMISSGRHELLIVLEHHHGIVAHAHYSDFRIENEKKKYAITSVGHNSGTLPNGLWPNVYQPFSTYDSINVNPKVLKLNTLNGGWWYHPTQLRSNLNGRYAKFEQTKLLDGIKWAYFTVAKQALKACKMMIRPVA